MIRRLAATLAVVALVALPTVAHAGPVRGHSDVAGGGRIVGNAPDGGGRIVG